MLRKGRDALVFVNQQRLVRRVREDDVEDTIVAHALLVAHPHEDLDANELVTLVFIGRTSTAAPPLREPVLSMDPQRPRANGANAGGGGACYAYPKSTDDENGKYTTWYGASGSLKVVVGGKGAH